MYHKQLVNHVMTKLQGGSSKEVIEAELLSDGWSKDDISEAFYYDAYPEKLRHFSFSRTLHSEVPTIFTIILLVVTITITSAVFFYFRNKTFNYTISLPVTAQEGQVEFSYGERPELSNPDFFGKVKQQFIDEKVNFIEADLSAMILRVYKESNLLLEVPIASKGREGSWWETPAGLYKVNSKEKEHFSGMARVWMPWSMNFQGNFYIHGRTYQNDGTLSSNLFTGGCIRLSTNDAEKVYNLTDIGTPLLVFEHSFSSDNFSYKDSALNLSAPIYMAADLGNNHVFSAKDATKKAPVSSLTKLMTALVATEYINLDNIATVPKSAIIDTPKPRLLAGQQLTIYQLLYPLLTESSNEAAETIARYYGRDKFIKHMNEKAVSIGMNHTNFTDPSGISADNTSTAEDLFMLTKYIYNNRSFIFNITSGKVKDNAYGGSGFSNITNLNNFIDNEFFFGGNNAKEANISVFEFPVGEIKRPVVTIVLNSKNEKDDSEKLIYYALNNFR